jgi:3-hydroxyisobutyrate dehydrogenase-like beta-hydroxyacid dehydrogenase
MNKSTRQLSALGFIGLGDVGLPMTRNLLAAGYSVRGCDVKQEPMTACVNAGGQTGSIRDIVESSAIVLTSLPSSESFVSIAENELIPVAREGQIFVELGTTIPSEITRLSRLFERQGAHLLDVPVSGGKSGAEKARLKMWAGGDRGVFEQCLPILAVIGGAADITYCGQSGMGQVMKGVNQLNMGLISAAHLEIAAFGIRSGLAPELIGKVFPSLETTIQRILKEEGNQIGVKFRELPYYIHESAQQGYALPMTGALYDFCNRGERVVVDDHRPAPSFWNELLRKSEKQGHRY